MRPGHKIKKICAVYIEILLWWYFGQEYSLIIFSHIPFFQRFKNELTLFLPGFTYTHVSTASMVKRKLKQSKVVKKKVQKKSSTYAKTIKELEKQNEWWDSGSSWLGVNSLSFITTLPRFADLHRGLLAIEIFWIFVCPRGCFHETKKMRFFMVFR